MAYQTKMASHATSELPNNVLAPKVMLDLMVASKDPRLPVVFDTVFDSDTATPRYVGLPSSPDDQPATVDSALGLSVAMYYDAYNRNSAVSPKVASPLPATVTAFVNGPTVVYNSTLERIATQKWIHLGIVQPYEAWAELRRTDYPVLPPDRLGGRPLERTVRVVYPSTEITNNSQSYAAVRAKDTPTTRVWWDVK